MMVTRNAIGANSISFATLMMYEIVLVQLGVHQDFDSYCSFFWKRALIGGVVGVFVFVAS